MGWLTEAFASDLTQRALLAGLLVAVTAALVGTWVVIRGLAFLGDALAHGVLPGIAVASVAGLPLVLGALVSAGVMAGGVALVSRRHRVADDTAIGLLFVGMLALGVVVISRQPTFAGDLTAFLFGDVLGVRDADLAVQAAVAVAAAAALAVGHRAFLALAFDRDKAASLGLHPALAHGALLALLALTVVASFRAVGTLLVFGLLIAPPATASLLVRRVPAMMATAVALGSLWVVAGLAVSYHADTAASATIAGLAVAGFLVVLAAQELGQRRWRRAAGTGDQADGDAPGLPADPQIG